MGYRYCQRRGTREPSGVLAMFHLDLKRSLHRYIQHVKIQRAVYYEPVHFPECTLYFKNPISMYGPYQPSIQNSQCSLMFVAECLSTYSINHFHIREEKSHQKTAIKLLSWSEATGNSTIIPSHKQEKLASALSCSVPAGATWKQFSPPTIGLKHNPQVISLTVEAQDPSGISRH